MRAKTKLRTGSPAPEVKREHPAVAAFQNSRWLYAAVSLVLLLPCFWQPHIEAGDLASHIYNAWLAHLIETGQIHGLHIASQTTNLLFDLMLGGLLNLLGPDWAQRIPVALSVLVFVWGAFAFARVVSGRMPWQIFPCIAILAYGWVFHMGFFNFYLSMGLGFWALALLWEPSPRRVAAAAAILAVAYVAHALPVVWVAGLAAYHLIARRLPGRSRLLLSAGAIAAILAIRIAIAAKWQSLWGANQITLTTGLDQAWVFDAKYFVVMVALLFFWIALFLNVTRTSGTREIFAGVPFQLCLMSAAAVFLIPSAIQIPGYKHSLAFIAERMSLGVGICVCALLACATPRTFERRAMVVVALLFFGFLFHDEHAINSFETQLDRAVATLPPGQRVLSAVDDPGLRVNLAHVIDRACIGHCYSYANYEPSTAQFRVRVDEPNPYVAYTYTDSWLLQNGRYVVKPEDLPLYQVDLNAAGEMFAKMLPAGAPNGSTSFNVLGGLL